jgi:6-phosphogluconolactonase/glucosamine-6-phosphate isomerase/deaminase
MLLVLKSNDEALGREAARIVARAVGRNPSIRLGLATGSTTIGMYRELARLHREESLDFSRVVTFNLDEYFGLAATHQQSFHFFMREHFFSQVNIPEKSIHIPDGAIKGDYDRYCQSAIPVASTCKSWASAATATSVSTSQPPASAHERG